jgi:glycosyltransferase involved in cell wall biosynthesis
VQILIAPFPGSRSLAGRLFRNGEFARRVVHSLARRAISPTVVHANDHQEGLLALAIARRLGAGTTMLLRSIATSRDDYFKYRCNEYDVVLAVGPELQARAREWDAGRPIELIHDGVAAEDFASPKPKPPRPPSRVLVIGSAQELKGWRDLFAALLRLERSGVLPQATFDFTGTQPDLDDADLRRLIAGRCRFLGRVEGFKDLVRGYDLVINSSRMESFGMAAIEVLAAGVALLSSRTGAIAQVQERDEMLFAPADPAALAQALQRIFTRWSDVDFGVAQAQENIRQRFSIDFTAAALDTAFQRASAARSRRSSG